MKILVIALLLLLTYISNVFASTHQCHQVNNVHCVHYLGAPFKTKGRYVKVTSHSISHIHCTKANSYDFIPQQFRKISAKACHETTVYDQCFDATCRYSKRLGIDNFTLNKKGKINISTPRTFKIHLLNYGKTCV